MQVLSINIIELRRIQYFSNYLQTRDSISGRLIFEEVNAAKYSIFLPTSSPNLNYINFLTYLGRISPLIHRIRYRDSKVDTDLVPSGAGRPI